MRQKAFTLIELLIVIAIIGLVMAISVFGLSTARATARDSRRKSDVETIRSALELFRSDCGHYPTGSLGSTLRGDGPASASTCRNSDVYLQTVPTDPSNGAAYVYRRQSTTTYDICTTLEQRPQGAGTVNCGTTTCSPGTCYYRVTNP